MEDIVIVGRHAIKEVVTSGYTINKIWTQGGIRKQQVNDILKNAKAQKLITQAVPKSKPDNLTNVSHRDVIALIASYEYADFDQFIQSQKEKEGLPAIIILNGLEDPYNFGSTVRMADASEVDGVAIPKRRSATFIQTVAEVSTGATQYVPVMRVIDSPKIIGELKNNGYWVAGAGADNTTDYRNMVADMPLIIVIGGGGQDTNRLVKDKCDFYIKIPTVGYVNSLNASVAANLTMYEVYHKQH